MLTIARPDDQRNKISGLHGDILKWSERMLFRTARCSGGQTLTSIPAA
jgi:hypothetical protein